MIWTETNIASALAHQTFQRKAVVITPNCFWTGYECDLLVVANNLKIIDVEIKISRADLKADAGKDKWWHHKYGAWIPETRRQEITTTVREWPVKVWKHYYCMPADIWDDKLLDSLASPASGMILLRAPDGRSVEPQVKRKATPNRDAMTLTAAQVLDVARLANLRYWDARTGFEQCRQRLTELGQPL